MKASLTMTRHVACVSPDQPLDEAWALMQRMNVRHLPVVEGAKLEGILSDRDVLVYSTPTSDGLQVPRWMPVERAMTSLPVTCRPDASVPEVAKLMLENKIDCVPVTDLNDVLVGLITSTDLITLLTEHHERSIPFTFRVELPE